MLKIGRMMMPDRFSEKFRSYDYNVMIVRTVSRSMNNNKLI